MFEKSENISQHVPTFKNLKKYIHWCTPPRAKHGQAKLVYILNDSGHMTLPNMVKNIK